MQTSLRSTSKKKFGLLLSLTIIMKFAQGSMDETVLLKDLDELSSENINNKIFLSLKKSSDSHLFNTKFKGFYRLGNEELGKNDKVLDSSSYKDLKLSNLHSNEGPKVLGTNIDQIKQFLDRDKQEKIEGISYDYRRWMNELDEPTNPQVLSSINGWTDDSKKEFKESIKSLTILLSKKEASDSLKGVRNSKENKYHDYKEFMMRKDVEEIISLFKSFSKSFLPAVNKSDIPSISITIEMLNYLTKFKMMKEGHIEELFLDKDLMDGIIWYISKSLIEEYGFLSIFKTSDLRDLIISNPKLESINSLLQCFNEDHWKSIELGFLKFQLESPKLALIKTKKSHRNSNFIKTKTYNFLPYENLIKTFKERLLGLSRDLEDLKTVEKSRLSIINYYHQVLVSNFNFNFGFTPIFDFFNFVLVDHVLNYFKRYFLSSNLFEGDQKLVEFGLNPEKMIIFEKHFKMFQISLNFLTSMGEKNENLGKFAWVKHFFTDRFEYSIKFPILKNLLRLQDDFKPNIKHDRGVKASVDSEISRKDKTSNIILTTSKGKEAKVEDHELKVWLNGLRLQSKNFKTEYKSYQDFFSKLDSDRSLEEYYKKDEDLKKWLESVSLKNFRREIEDMNKFISKVDLSL